MTGTTFLNKYKGFNFNKKDFFNENTNSLNRKKMSILFQLALFLGQILVSHVIFISYTDCIMKGFG